VCDREHESPHASGALSRYFVSEVFLDLGSRASLAVQRAEVGDGCFEATLLLAQVFASLPESLARHVRLVGSSLQFTHALTAVQLVAGPGPAFRGGARQCAYRGAGAGLGWPRAGRATRGAKRHAAPEKRPLGPASPVPLAQI
jgi:hypothetical protein